MQNTIGVDILTKRVEKKDISLKVDILDTSGQEKFRATTSNYVKKADYIIFVYDLTGNILYIYTWFFFIGY